MVFVDKNVDEMLKEIMYSEGRISRDDSLVPSENLEGYIRGVTTNYLSPDEKYISQVLEDIFGKRKWNSREYGVLAAALENAFTRGNEGLYHFPVELRVFEGDKGHVIRIKDSGVGFNFRDKINKLRSGEKYAVEENGYGDGYGLRAMDRSKLEVSYQNNGNIVNILIKKKS